MSAVVVNYNAGHHLVECVRSLRANGVDDVVVVDNGSTDGSHQAAAQHDGGVRIIQTGANLGFGTAANRGVEAAWHEYVLVLNPDATIEPGTTKVLAEALDRDPALAVVGPRVDNPDGSVYPSARRFPDLRVAAGHAFLGLVFPQNRFSRHYQMIESDRTRPTAVDWVSGTCMLVRRSAFSILGGFDEGYFMYVEDVDLCWRFWRAGWRVGYEPDARVVHAIGVSSDQVPYRMIVAHHRSLLRYAQKTTHGAGRLLLPLVAVGLAARAGLAMLHRAMGGVARSR